MNWMSDWNSEITFAKLLLRVVKKWRHSLLGKESKILIRDCKSIFIKMYEDGGSVKNFRRLHDVIYGWPLICYITIQSLRNSEIELQSTKIKYAKLLPRQVCTTPLLNSIKGTGTQLMPSVGFPLKYWRLWLVCSQNKEIVVIVNATAYNELEVANLQTAVPVCINSLLIFSVWWEISIDVRNIVNLSHLIGKLNN
jgi:hypothetical protein